MRQSRNKPQSHSRQQRDEGEGEFKPMTYGYKVVFFRDLTKDLEKDLVKNLENLTGNQKKIVEEIVKNARITQEELSRLIGITEKNIRNNIARLKQKGLLKRVGPDKGGHWEIIGK